MRKVVAAGADSMGRGGERTPEGLAQIGDHLPRGGRYARIMPKSYLMSRKWALTDRFAITDESGMPQFEVQGRFAFSKRLSIRDSAGAEVALISRPGLLTRYEILVGSQLATVRPRGFLGQRFEIDSAAGRLEARGNFSGRQYSVTRGGMQAAAVTQLRTLRERFAVEITDGEDPVLMLAVVLVIEIIRDDRRRSTAAGASSAAAGG
jgi:uncharacterized protein YxjI